MNDAQIGTEAAQERWWRRRWIAWSGAVLVVLVVAGAIAVRWALRQIEPRLRQKVVETLSARFHSPVELDRLSVSMRNGVIVSGGGVRILSLAGRTKLVAQPDAPPMLAVDSFEFGTGWRELLRPVTRVVSVKVHGLQVNIPPKEERDEAMPVGVDGERCGDAIDCGTGA